MKPSKQIGLLQSQLDKSLPSRWIWVAEDLQEIGIQVAKLEGENESHRNGIAYKTLFAIAQEQKEEIEALRQDD